jgi:hypothetical protein
MMSFVVFGGLIVFAVYAMVHFLHEWRESKHRRDEDDDDEP